MKAEKKLMGIINDQEEKMSEQSEVLSYRAVCEHIANELNRVLDLDPDTVAGLFNIGIPCKTNRLLNDWYVPISQSPETGNYYLYLIGLLNALTKPLGYYLMAEFEDDIGWRDSVIANSPDYYKKVGVRLVGFHIEPIYGDHPKEEEKGDFWP